MKSKPQLGKGMAALLGGAIPHTSENAEARPNIGFGPIGPREENQPIKSTLATDQFLVSIDQIVPTKNQPRKIFKEKDLQELSESIKENGIIQPLVVTGPHDGKFELIAGERRLRAAKLAGLERVPVVIKKTSKKDHLVMSIIENVQRADLNCIEEGLAYFQLMNEFGLTQEEVAKKIGKERSTVANFLRILKLPKEVILLLNKEQLSFGHAKLLVGLNQEELIKRAAQEAATKNLSVRELEGLIKELQKSKKPVVKNAFVNQQYLRLKDQIEKKTGWHVEIKANTKGAGSLSLVFNNEAEFNDIYSFLTKG
jgi:ParB family chromosome partitioning protein